MSQAFPIPTDNASPLADLRADHDNALLALQSAFSGDVAPLAPVAFMFWADTSSGWMRQRDATNSVWLDRWPIEPDTNVLAGPMWSIGRMIFHTDRNVRRKIIDLPINHAVLGGGVRVITAFNGSAGANLISVGYGSLINHCVQDANVGTPQLIPANGTEVGIPQASARVIEAIYTYAGASGLPTGGKAWVWIYGMHAQP